MGKYLYTDEEQKFNMALKYQDEQLNDITTKVLCNSDDTNAEIKHLEAFLKNRGVDPKRLEITPNAVKQKTTLVVPSWEQLCAEAEASVGKNCDLESFFTEDELKSNEEYIEDLRNEFNQLHRLDKIDVTISAIAGIVAGVVDILLVGIPHRGRSGLEAGPLSDYIRAYFDKVYPPDEMEKLANSKASKVSFDAQDNRHTRVHVEGLSAYYHRLLQLGHDPVLGFVVGVMDIMTGRMTTIDKAGNLVSQTMENYQDRVEPNVFKAIAKEFLHLKSDITTSMGLPAPLMGLFNLMQFGSVGEEELTVAEIVQGMYYEGYDFIHFCASSIPVMITEVIVRLCYAIKRVKEGHTIKESIPVSLNREKHPKLATMLFIANSAATGINLGKVLFTKNPLAINYPQWLAFAKYSYGQLKWSLINKPEAREAYVEKRLNDEMTDLIEQIDKNFEEFSKDYTVVFN